MYQLELSSRPIANLAHLMLLVNGAKDWDPAWVNDYEEIRLIQEIKQVIPKRGAAIYLKLQKAGLVPNWVEKATDTKKMKRAAI